MSCHALTSLASNEFELDLPYEVLYVLVGQESAKMSKPKLEVTQTDSTPPHAGLG